MDEKQEDLKYKRLDMLLHAHDNPSKADISCPHAAWMGYDLNHCPGVGEWKCMLQRYEYASDQYGVDSVDYIGCRVKYHKSCEIYKHNDKVKK